VTTPARRVRRRDDGADRSKPSNTGDTVRPALVHPGFTAPPRIRRTIGLVSTMTGLCNVRDVGGLPTENGRSTRTGVLYRSDAPLPGDPPPAGIAAWPPRTVLDLRSSRERAAAPHPLTAGTTVVLPVALIDDARGAGAAAPVLPSGTEPGRWFVALYRRWLREHPVRIVEAITAAVQAEAPVLVHCAAGRDRTGVVTALLLRAAGVRRDAVVADYRRTEENQALIADRHALAAGFPGGRAALAGLRTPEAIEHVLDVVDGHSGGTAGWLLAHGASEADLARWSERLVGP
jgi:protein-tyrosine phosphatase